MKNAAISTLGEQCLLSNYGTFFQHYALRRVLREMDFVPFRVSHLSDRYERTGFLWNWIKDALRPVFWLLRMRPNWWTHSRRMFEGVILNMLFLFDYRKLIGRFRESQDFENAAIGIMGGDQILSAQTEREWLNDIPVGGKRITYAASTDWEVMSNNVEWRKLASKQFARYHAIGIREQAGVMLCRELAGSEKMVTHVADPVMLLNSQDYKGISCMKGMFKRPTLFCYLVNVRSADYLKIREYEKLAKMLRCELKMVGIQGAELYIPSRYRIRLRPVQFLRAMIDASYVVTNSYHGSVFAAIFKKNFLSIWQDCPKGTNQNERQKEFMAKFGIDAQWIDWRAGAEKWYHALVEPIDWNSVLGGIDVFRRESLAWLKEVINA